jgi:hypothetical protein
MEEDQMTTDACSSALSNMSTYESVSDTALVREIEDSHHRWDDTISNPSLSVVDGTIQAVCEACDNLDAIHGLGRLSVVQQRTLFVFAVRMAVAVLRGGPVGKLRVGIVALAIENAQFDPRDTLMSLAALQHAARNRGVDFHLEGKKCSHLFRDPFKKYFHDFVQRESALTTLEQFALHEVVDSNGVTIAWQPCSAWARNSTEKGKRAGQRG